MQPLQLAVQRPHGLAVGQLRRIERGEQVDRSGELGCEIENDGHRHHTGSEGLTKGEVSPPLPEHAFDYQVDAERTYWIGPTQPPEWCAEGEGGCGCRRPG
jgi:hypothetical protein